MLRQTDVELIEFNLKANGYGSAQNVHLVAESMRRAFLRIVRVPPAAYRHRFRAATLH